MGWQDREYAREGGAARPRVYYRGSGAHTYDVATRIIIANIIVYVVSHLIPSLGERIYGFGVMHAGWVLKGQVWRLFTATYLHADFFHIFMNMLLLYFAGPWVERRWGGRQFFWVYTIAGIAGNVLITLAGAVNYLPHNIPGLGASGSVLAVLGAAAVMFPHAEVLVYFLIPVRIRTAVTVYAIYYVINVWNKGSNYGGDICHLAGLAVGAGWAYWGAGILARRGGGVGGFSRSVRKPNFKERVRNRQKDQATVDSILKKVYNQGVHSLSPAERKTLTEATERLRQNEVG